MKPLFHIAATICLVLAINAHPENNKEAKELPQTKELVVEAEKSEPQARTERCTACSANLNLKSPKDILAAIQQLPGEVHTQESFEGCSSDKGCAGIKVKDGRVVQKYGSLDSLKQAASLDTANEFSFHEAGADSNLPFWWMKKNSPFKTSGSFEKFSKSSSYKTASSGVGTLENPAIQSSSFKSSYTSSTNGGVDLSSNPFFNGGGFSAGQSVLDQYSGQSAFNAANFGQGAGFVGSSPRPFTASTAGSSVFENNYQGSGVSSQSIGGSRQTCAGEGYTCVPRSQCYNGEVNTNGINLQQASSQKQYCNLQNEICCRIVTSGSTGSGSLQGSFDSLSTNLNQGSNVFSTSSGQSFGSQASSSFGSGFDSINRELNSFGAKGTYGSSSSSFGSGASVNRGSGIDAFSTSNGFGSIGSTIAPTTPYFGSTDFRNDISKSTGQSNFIETDSFSAGSENSGVFGPGQPYLPPVSSTNFASPTTPATFVTTPTFTPRPITPRPFSTAKPTYLPPVSSTSGPGYLPPYPAGEASNPQETRVPTPGPNYNDGQIILDVSRQPTVRPPFRPVAPPQAPREIPAGCAAALKCTPIEYCTAEGVISTTPVALTREQEAYRVPLTDCKDLASGIIGKCCRDPTYTDPWPTNQLGQWVPGVFGGNDGRYVPDSRGSPSTNVRPQISPRPTDKTGSVTMDTFLTTPKPNSPTFGPNQITPGYPSSTVTPFVQKNQYDVVGQGQYSKNGIGKNSLTGVGTVGVGQTGQVTQTGVGQRTEFGVGQIGQGGFGTIQRGQTGQFGVGQTSQPGGGIIGTVQRGQTTQFGINKETQVGVGQRGQIGVGTTQTTQRGQSGIGQTTQFGVGQGSKVGVGQGTQFGVGQGSQFGVGQAGVGQGTQFGVGQGSKVGFGQETQFGVGQGTQFGVGQAGVGQGTQFGIGQGSKVGVGQGTQFGVGQGSQFGVNQVGVGQETQFGVGQGSKFGVGQGTQFGVGQGSQFGVGQAGVGQGTQFGIGQGSKVGVGQETQFGVGQGTQFGVGQAGVGQRTQFGVGQETQYGVGQGTQVGVGQIGTSSVGIGSTVERGQGGQFGVGQVSTINRGTQTQFGKGTQTTQTQGQGFSEGFGNGVITGQGVGQITGIGQGVKQGVGQQGTVSQFGVGQYSQGSVGQGQQVGQGGFGGNGIGTGVQQGVGNGVITGQGYEVTQGGGQRVIGGGGQEQYDQSGSQSILNQGGKFGVGQTTGFGFDVTQGGGSRVTLGQGSGANQGFGSNVRYQTGQQLVSERGQALLQGKGGTITQGQGEIVTQGKGQIVTQEQGQGVKQGVGQYTIQGTVTQRENEGVKQGGGAIITQEKGQTVSGGQGYIVTQGQGQIVKQGGGVIITQGKGQIIKQDGGQIVTHEGGPIETQGGGQYVTQGGGQYVIQGQGQGVLQGFGTGSKQGQGFLVSQGGGIEGENDYSASTQRVFLQNYAGNGQCGLLNPQRPYGNRNDLEVDFAEIPWQAMVLLQTNRSLLCGGVITRPEVVVTSASCVDGLEAKNVLIKGGEWKLGIDDEPLPFQIVQVKTILLHPEYKRGSLKYDVAILVLSENLRFAQNIQPICLPSAEDTLDAFYNGAGQSIVTGWGKVVLQAHLSGSIMHSVNMSLINPDQCEAKLSQDYPHLLEQYDQDSCVCGQPSNPLNNICKVDIGSALACTTGDSHFVLRGIYSWDSGCQTGNQIAVFYKFDIEWYEWAIGLIESVRFAKYTIGTRVIQNKITTVKTSQVTSGVKGSVTGIKGVITGVGGAGTKEFGQFSQGGLETKKFGGFSSVGTGVGQFGQFAQGGTGLKQLGQIDQSQFSFSGTKGVETKGQDSALSADQLTKFTEIQSGVGGLDFGTQIKGPISKTFTTTYTEKKVFQTEPKVVSYTTKPEIVTFTTKPEYITYTTKPKIVTYTTKPKIITYTTKPEIVTYTTKPEIVTYTTKPEYFTYTTKPKIVTYTTKPKIVTYTTKPQFITYETSGSGTNPQYVAPGVTFNPSFSDVIGKHKHDNQCKCLEGQK